VTERALAAGKHVLLEKPIALNHEDGAALVKLAEQTDRIFMIAHVLRFWPEYAEIKRIIESGQLGQPISAVAFRRQPFPAWSDQVRQPKNTGGAILDQMIHDYDAVNWLFGTPKAVSARAVRSPRTGAYDQSQVLVEYDGGSAMIDGGMMMPESYPFTTLLDVLCDDGAIEYHFRAGGRSFEIGEPSNELKLFPKEGDPQVIELPQTDAFENECAYFVECVRNNRKPELGLPADSLLALDVALAAQRSADTGERVIIGA
jgi:predicted dehydrogenase